MPDIHPGKGIPVGAAVLTKGTLYPHIIGNDIGCGMGLFSTHLETRKFKIDRFAKELDRLTALEEIPLDECKNDAMGLRNGEALGTIGGGNHFAEFQSVETVYNQEAFSSTGLSEKGVHLLVHSGSRGLGDSTLRFFIEQHHAQLGLEEGSDAFEEYLKEHAVCLAWATQNRKWIAIRLMAALGLKNSIGSVLDTPHNFIQPIELNGERGYIHRKGVSESLPLNIIPGSRGTLTYLVQRHQSGFENLFSVPHGAGRKWERSACKGKLENKYTRESIRISRYGSPVICKQKELLYEEAAESYKNIDQVVQDMVEEGIVTVVATFKPLLTVKF